MKLIYIIFERIKSHFKNHKTVMAMFLLGVFASSIFFAYFYGDTVLATRADLNVDEKCYFTVTSAERFDCNDPRIIELEKDHTVTFKYSLSFDQEKSSDIFSEKTNALWGGITNPITCLAKRDNDFGFANRYGRGDVKIKTNSSGIWLSVDATFYLDTDKLTSTDDPYLHINGEDIELIGIHEYSNLNCIPFKYAENNDLKAYAIEIKPFEVLNSEEAEEYREYIRTVFPEAKNIQTGFDRTAEELKRDEETLPLRIRRALLVMLLSVFTFMFLAKYLFDMSFKEDITYRILGAERGNIALIAFGEIVILASIAIFAGLVTHAALYDVIFGEISRYSGLTFTFWNYLFIGACALFACIISCLPFIFIVWKKSAVNSKNRI